MGTVEIVADNAVPETLPPRDRLHRIGLLSAAIAAAVFVAIASLFVFHGNPNADEGFYAVISHEVMQGRLPYRDLAYTQTPLLPYIQGAAMSLIGFGVEQQRWLNVSYQAISLALVVYYLVRRRLSLIIAVGLIAAWCLCIPLLYYGTIGKTYALAQLFLIIAGLCVVETVRPMPGLILLSLCGVLAVGCRLTVAPTVVILWLGYCRIHAKSISTILLFSTPLLFTILLFGPFVVADPDNAYFWMWGYHTQSMIMPARIASIVNLPLFAPGITVIAIFGLVGALHQYSQERFPGFCVILAGAIGAILNVAASGVYLEYAVPCMGLIILGSGTVLAPFPFTRRWYYPSALLCALVSIASFFMQDRNWGKGNYLADIKAGGHFIASQSTPDDQLLTSMPELALAAKRSLYPRSEMGKFAITIEMSPQKAFHRRMLSFGELVYLTEQGIPKVIGLSAHQRWSFSWSIPSLNTLPDEYYKDFCAALIARYNCTFTNESFIVYTRKPFIRTP